jgi:hypothetical protein
VQLGDLSGKLYSQAFYLKVTRKTRFSDPQIASNASHFGGLLGAKPISRDIIKLYH